MLKKMGLKCNIKNITVMTTGIKMSKWWIVPAFQAEPSIIKKQALKKYAAIGKAAMKALGKISICL